MGEGIRPSGVGLKPLQVGFALLGFVLILIPTGGAHTKHFLLGGSLATETIIGTGLAVAVVDCGDGSDPVLNISIGGFCFGTKADGNLPADYPTDSDCVPNSLGECHIALSNLHHLAGLSRGGTYCQDLDRDGLCGEFETDFQTEGFYVEPRVLLCYTGNGLVIKSPLNPTPRRLGVVGESPSETNWLTDNWDPDHSILFFVTSPVRSNQAINERCPSLFLQGEESILEGLGCHPEDEFSTC